MYGQGANQNDSSIQSGRVDSGGFYVPPPIHDSNLNMINAQSPYQPQQPPPPPQQQHQQPQQHQQQQHHHQQQQQPQQQQPSQTRQPFAGVSRGTQDGQYASYAPRNVPSSSHSRGNPGGFMPGPSYSQNQTQRHVAPQNQFYTTNQQFQPSTGNASPPQSNITPSMSERSSPGLPRMPAPPMPNPVSDFSHLSPSSQTHSNMNQQNSFYNPQSQQQYQQQHQPQHQFPSQQPVQPSQQAQQQMPGMQAAIPFMLAGMQQMSGTTGGMNPALGAQLFQTLAPGAAGYTNQLFGQSNDKVRSFMRMPKYYFAVNHSYVLKKLSLILMPYTNRTWARQRGMDAGQFEGSGSDGATSYLPPRDDVNAPDLYIPLMAFLTYVLMVGFVFGMRNEFRAEMLAKYFSKGLGVLTLEVLIIKLGLYLINARPTPWLDVIAYRGYKFVGVVLTMMMGLVFRPMYYPALFYSASAMGIFLMRSHRRIILPRDMDMQQTQDLARRNAFLLFVSVLQFPIYGVLVLDGRST